MSIDHSHTTFIFNIVALYTSRIVDTIEDDDYGFPENLQCKEVTKDATSRDWKGNYEAIIADIDRLIASGDLPAPFEQGHCRRLAASRGYQMRETSQLTGSNGFYTLYKIADGTYLQNKEEGTNTFTEWCAYKHLLNLPPDRYATPPPTGDS